MTFRSVPVVRWKTNRGGFNICSVLETRNWTKLNSGVVFLSWIYVFGWIWKPTAPAHRNNSKKLVIYLNPLKTEESNIYIKLQFKNQRKLRMNVEINSNGFAVHKLAHFKHGNKAIWLMNERCNWFMNITYSYTTQYKLLFITITHSKQHNWKLKVLASNNN